MFSNIFFQSEVQSTFEKATKKHRSDQYYTYQRTVTDHNRSIFCILVNSYESSLICEDFIFAMLPGRVNKAILNNFVFSIENGKNYTIAKIIYVHNMFIINLTRQDCENKFKVSPNINGCMY